MPFSHSAQISTIVGFAEQLQPQSVLDVGAGMGQYGFLLRTALEGEHLFVVEGTQGRQRPREEWRVRIDGIEGFAGYLTPVHGWAYDEVRIGDALEVLPTIAERSVDLVLAIDILEHFETPHGLVFLEHCRRIARVAALVSTPKQFHAQEVPANPFENHRSVWTERQLADEGYTRVLDDATSWIVVAQR